MFGTMQDAQLSIRNLYQYGQLYYPDVEIATYDGARTHRRTLGDTARSIGRLASGLARLGVEPGARVGTFCWNHDRHLEAYFAIPMIGCVLHTINVRLAPEQIAYIVNHAGDSAIIVDHSLVPVLAECARQFTTVTHYIVVGGPAEGLPGETVCYEQLVENEEPDFVWPELDERQASAICYTSGTTGNPKGVAYTHRSTVLHSLMQAGANVYGLSSRDKVIATASMFHANSWGLPYTAWMVGAAMVLPGRYLQPEHLAHLIETERPTFSAGVPTIWNDVLRYAEKAGSDLSSLRTVVLGGAAAPPVLIERYKKSYGVDVVQGYGMTETSPLVALSWPPPNALPDAATHYLERTGRPVPGVEVRLVGDDGSVLPWDDTSVGELQLRGPWITGSYLGDVDTERFEAGWLRTGDVARIDASGYIQITDRAKDVIKSGGEWISSVELENALATHSNVIEAAVIGVPDDRWQERPLACVVLAEGASPDPVELARHITDKVARWWVPEKWAFIDSVPKTSVGKFDKKALRQRYQEQALTVALLARDDRPSRGGIQT